MELIRCCIMILALNLVRVSLVQASACVYEACTCAGDEVTCENLKSIPPLVTEGSNQVITMTYFAAGNIADVKDNSLPPNLTTIYFVENPIINISSNAFLSSVKTLNTLFIRKAAFTTLPDALGKLQRLAYLDIYDTHIHDWNQPVLENISKTLKGITLQNVGLKAWPSWISLFSVLQSIIISGSPLETIPDGVLDHTVATLQSLRLIDVNLSTIPPAISNLTLMSLSLSSNKLSNVTGISKSENLDLSFNIISDAGSLSNALYPSAGFLTSLYLDSNNLTVIPDFSHLIELDQLSLTDNQISDPNSGSLPQSLDTFKLSGNRFQSVPTIAASLTNLLVLYLSSNQIASFSASAFPQQLEELHLDDNKITQLVASSFPIGSKLTRLFLQSNPLASIHRSAFLPLKNLKFLNLDDTQLVQVPVALISLNNLNELRVEDIPTINCSCPRDTLLVQWFNSSTLSSVYGSCSSGVGIKDFYTVTECGISSPAAGLAPTLLFSILRIFSCLFLLVIV